MNISVGLHPGTVSVTPEPIQPLRRVRFPGIADDDEIRGPFQDLDDAGYTGILTHNPMEDAQLPGFKTHWLRREPYTLGELGDYIPFRWRRLN